MAGLGHLAKFGLKAGIAGWTTAYAAVDTMIPFIDEGLTEAYERNEDDSLEGSGGRRPSEQGNKAVQGPINVDLDYANYLDFFEGIFGAESAGVYTITDDALAKYYWLEFEKQVERWRWGACKFGKLSITGEKGQAIKTSIDVIARLLERSATAFPGISPSARSRILFEQLTFRLGDQVDALAGGDIFEIESFGLEFDRHLKADDYVATGTAATAVNIIEPIPAEKRTLELKIKLPRYSANTLQGWKTANTALQADLSFTDGVTTFLFEMPELRLTGGFDVETTGPDPYAQEGTFEVRIGGGVWMYTGNEVKLTVS